MLRIPNAFNFRVADQSVIDTTLFLDLYSPIHLLDNKNAFDFTAPKLVTFKGSPGSGKSSVLRLFDTSTLIALCNLQSRGTENDIVGPLTELEVLVDDRPRAFGIYVHCDSSLRDIHNLEAGGANVGLLNTLLDVRILSGFVRSLDMLNQKYAMFGHLEAIEIPPLSSGDLAPEMFTEQQTIGTLRHRCHEIEKDFAEFLNSFPGDSRPDSIIPHARIYAIKYLAGIISTTPVFKDLVPIIMVDDLHELYEDQREQIATHFLERNPIPRWIAVRKQVDELENLISVVGNHEGREYQEINLDSASPSLFRKFVANVANRRLRMSSDLQPFVITEMEQQLGAELLPRVTTVKIAKQIDEVLQKIRESEPTFEFDVPPDETIEVNTLVGLEAKLIIQERNKTRRQPTLFEMPVPQKADIDAKVHDAARLFASKRYGIPYYFSFDVLAACATGNVEQFLANASPFAEKMIARAELNRETQLSPAEQERILKRSAESYFDAIERQLDYGYAIKQLVENLGIFFNAVTYRPSAPIAPGANGFAFTRMELRNLLESRKKDRKVMGFRDILTRAVAGNVLFVREAKQGQTGTENVIFYLNRLLCVKYELPLGTGGFQHIDADLLIAMMSRPVKKSEWGKRWVEPLLGGDET